MKKIEYLTERVTQGLEIYPLCSEHTPHPSYVQYHDHYFVKSGIIMHILENKIKEHFDKLLKILFQETVKQKFTLNTKNFMRKFKKVCGFSPKMLNNWLYKTGAVELKIRQKWMKKSNSVEFEIEQQNWILNYLSRCKEINKKQENKILTKHNLYSNNYLHRNANDRKYETYNLELQRAGRKLFQDKVPLLLHETDGTVIKQEQHQLDLKDNKSKITLTFILRSRVKKNTAAKKKDNIYGPAFAQDTWLLQPSDSVYSEGGQFTNDEIFKTKNIECSLLWIRVDPDFDLIRTITVEQDESNWHYQLLRETDIVGQYEAIQALKKFNSENAYNALKYVIG